MSVSCRVCHKPIGFDRPGAIPHEGKGLECVDCYQPGQGVGKRNVFICGPAGTGKSTIAKLLAKRHAYYHTSEGKALRQVVVMAGLNPLDRAQLQLVGEGLRNLMWETVWLEAVLHRVEGKGFERVVIDDIRHPHDANVLLDKGWLGLKVCCPQELRDERLCKRDGPDVDLSLCDVPSERLMINYPRPLLTVDNSGTLAELEEKVQRIVGGMGNG